MLRKVIRRRWLSESFTEKLEQLSGKGKGKAKATTDGNTDILGAALAERGLNSSYENKIPEMKKKSPPEELYEEIQKIKDRLSILPIKSSGAIFGPGEGVMKILEKLRAAEEQKKKKNILRMQSKRLVDVKRSGLRLPNDLLSEESIRDRQQQLQSIKPST